MVRRQRQILKKVYLSDKENEELLEKMKLTNIRNFSAFARKALLEIQIINLDMSNFSNVAKELNAIGKNINQLVRLANQERSVYAETVDDMQYEINKCLITVAKLAKDGIH